jgi:4-amino-4-deoxy-L-arabinose transferase-like glycosyltransferase
MHREGPPDTRLFTRGSSAVLALILLLALAVRFSMMAHAAAFPGSDGGEYFRAAYSLSRNGEFPLPLKRAPLYPVFLTTVITALGPSLDVITAAQHVLGLSTVLLGYLVATVAFGRVTGLLAALGISVNGSLLLLEHSIMAEALYTPLLLLGLLLLLLAFRSGRLRLFLAAGVVLGFASLNRTATQAILPVAFAVVAFQPRSWRQRLAMVGLLSAGFLLVVTPWIVRNQTVHGVPAITSGLGDSLYVRVNRHDTSFDFRSRGQLDDDDTQARMVARVYELGRSQPYAQRVRGRLQDEFGLSEAQGDAVLRQAALQVIRQQPERYVASTLEMLATISFGREPPLEFFWEPRFDWVYARNWANDLRPLITRPAPRSDDDRRTVERLTTFYRDYRFGPLVPILFVLGSLRCFTGLRRGLPLLPLVVVSQLLLYVALDGAVFRYRYPLQPVITLLACAGLTLVTSTAWSWAADRRFVPRKLFARVDGVVSLPRSLRA